MLEFSNLFRHGNSFFFFFFLRQKNMCTSILVSSIELASCALFPHNIPFNNNNNKRGEGRRGKLEIEVVYKMYRHPHFLYLFTH